MRRWPPLLSCLVMLGALVATVLRTIRWPNDWAEAHWLLDYRFGFVKRGLVGQVFTWVTGLLGIPVGEGLIGGVALVICVGFCGLLLLLAYRIAEDRRVFLPLAISADGAFLTHSQALVQVPTRAKVDRFLPAYNRGDLQLHPDNPITVAPQANEDWVIEIRRQNDEAMKRASTVVEEAYADFRKVFGRGPENPWFEEYMTEDADVILVGMGTISLPFKVGIRNMRAQGKKVGLIRPRWFRPFPTEKMVAALSRAKAIGVIDRDYSFGSPFGSGVVANEIRAAMYNADKRPPLLSFICGLGGREVTLEDVYKATDLCFEAAKSGKSPLKTQWLGVRE